MFLSKFITVVKSLYYIYICRFTHSKSRDCDCGSYCAIVLLENNYIKLSTNHTHTRAAICTPWLFNSFVCSASLIIIQILKICPHEIISNLFYNHSFGGNASMAVSRTYYLCIFFLLLTQETIRNLTKLSKKPGLCVWQARLDIMHLYEKKPFQTEEGNLMFAFSTACYSSKVLFIFMGINDFTKRLSVIAHNTQTG